MKAFLSSIPLNVLSRKFKITHRTQPLKTLSKGLDLKRGYLIRKQWIRQVWYFTFISISISFQSSAWLNLSFIQNPLSECPCLSMKHHGWTSNIITRCHCPYPPMSNLSDENWSFQKLKSVVTMLQNIAWPTNHIIISLGLHD